MLFTKENAEKVMAGTKTQTRRVVKDGEFLTLYFNWDVMQEVPTVFHPNRHIKWQVGKTYAVCPGRGKPAIGRIRLLSIRKEKLRDISQAGIRAEGIVINPIDELQGKPFSEAAYTIAYARLWDSINPKSKRWADNPDVWALTFEVVR